MTERRLTDEEIQRLVIGGGVAAVTLLTLGALEPLSRRPRYGLVALVASILAFIGLVAYDATH